jgi:hypothetical protein
MGVRYDRRGFLAAAGATFAVGNLGLSASAGSARSGSWCVRKKGSPFEFRLYELTDDGSESVFELASLSGSPVMDNEIAVAMAVPLRKK